MTPTEQMARVEERAFALRMTMAEICAAAGVKQPVWSRAKHRGTVSPKLLGRIEAVVSSIERQRQADDDQPAEAAA